VASDGEPVDGRVPGTPPVAELVAGADDVGAGGLVVVVSSIVGETVSPGVVVVGATVVVVDVVEVVVVDDVVVGWITLSCADVKGSGVSLVVGKNDASSVAAPSCAPVAVKVIVPV
jgi:hypothetical protein